MFEFFANLFGYVLNFIYSLVNNYGLAMILFTIVIKIAMLPLSIKQQRMMKKNSKVQEKTKILQFKYKNDPEKLNQEMMSLYKEEKMNPLSGCFGAIIQFVLLISIFYMVRSPLTFMKKIDQESLNSYIKNVEEQGKSVKSAYPEIDIIREANAVAKENPDDEEANKLAINMEFLGLDLSKVPQQNLEDWTVYIIPILYIISTFISMRLTTAMQQVNKKKEVEVIDITENVDKEEKPEKEIDAMAQTNKMMGWMMPIMSVSISLVAPLGLALYWLSNNVAMILERLLLNKFMKED